MEFSIYDIISALKQLCIFNIYTLGLGMLNSVMDTLLLRVTVILQDTATLPGCSGTELWE